MGRARKQLEGIWGDGQGTEAIGKYVGRWAGRVSDGEVYEENSGHFVVGPPNPTLVFRISSKLPI